MRDLLEALKVLDQYGLIPHLKIPKGHRLRATKAELAAQLDKPHKRKILSEEEKKEARIMFIAGQSKRAIARHFGVAESTIYRLKGLPKKNYRSKKQEEQK